MPVDRLGVELNIDDVVAMSGFSSGLSICKIVRFTTKMVKLISLDSNGRWRVKKEIAAYANDMIKVDQQQALIYLLKKDNK